MPNVVSPYLKPYRLQHVIALIQAMGVRDDYKEPLRVWREKVFPGWTEQELKVIFDEHPEFFRQSPSSEDQYCLVYRRFMPKMGGQEADEDARRPALDAGQVKNLIEIANGLHAKQLEERKDRRWILSLALPAVGSLIGAVIGASATMFAKK